MGLTISASAAPAAVPVADVGSRLDYCDSGGWAPTLKILMQRVYGMRSGGYNGRMAHKGAFGEVSLKRLQVKEKQRARNDEAVRRDSVGVMSQYQARERQVRISSGWDAH